MAKVVIHRDTCLTLAFRGLSYQRDMFAAKAARYDAALGTLMVAWGRNA